MFARAAAALNVTPDVVEATISALSAVLIFAARKNASQKDFINSITSLSLTEECYETLINVSE